MAGNRETNPHFLPRRDADPVIELFPRTPPSPAPPRIRHQRPRQREHPPADTRYPKPQPAITGPPFKSPGPPVVHPGREPHSGYDHDHDHPPWLQKPQPAITGPPFKSPGPPVVHPGREPHSGYDHDHDHSPWLEKPQPAITGPPFKSPGPPVVHPGREPHSGHDHDHDHSPWLEKPQPAITGPPFKSPGPPVVHSGHDHSSLLQAPKQRRTRPAAWLVAAVCAVFWIVVIIGGLIVLTFYLVFKPRDPRFDLSSATFNAAYLDVGYFLNADVTLLINFTNPNTKADVDFSFIAVDLYYQNDFIATRYVQPFSVMRTESMFANVNMLASEVRVGAGVATELRRQMGYGRITFDIRAVIRTRSRFGALFRYSYWLYPYCKIELTSPPFGVLVRKHCVTKR